jgi:hypothetical protein
MVEKIADKVRPHLAEFEQDTVTWSYDVVGETPDIGRFLTGEPECMMMPMYQPIARHGRVVTILVDMCASASINPEQIQARGAAIVALIETLQIIGHTVELWAEVSTKSAGKGDVVTTLVKIKSPSEYIDDDHLMYVLAHPSLLRRHCFAQWETPKHAWERFASEGGRGTPKPATQGEAIGADVIVHGPRHGDPVITSPAEWVKMALKSLGLWEED